MRDADGVATCAASLADTSRCCEPDCALPPVLAVLCDNDGRLIEHLVCGHHALLPDAVASKPLPRIRPEWSS